jgi:hypothetical protein
MFQEWQKCRSKVTLRTTLHTLKSPLTTKELCEYYEAVANLRPILEDPFLYKVTLLLTLTFFAPSLTDAYLRTLWRHFKSMKVEDGGGDKKAKEVVVRVYSSLYSILKVSKILMKVANV